MRRLSQIMSSVVGDEAPDDENIGSARGKTEDIDDPELILPQLLLKEILPRGVLSRLKAGRPVAITILAPETAQSLVSDALREMSSDALRIVHCRERKNDSDQLAGIAAVASGSPVVYFTHNATLVPELARKLCEATFEVPPVTPEMLRKVLRQCTRGKIHSNFSPDLSNLPLPVICAAISSGAHAEHSCSALTRLAAPSPNPDGGDYPRLETCLEYGALRNWGLRLSDDLKAWRAGQLAAADLDTSVLMVSPPGFGKTYFAGVLQKHLNVPLFRLSVGELFAGDGYLNTTLKTMTKVFESARKAAPSILFLDEVDMLQRRSEGHKNDAYFNAVVNHALVLLDGSGAKNSGVVILAATNRPEALDPALTRPGRLSRTIEVALPDFEAREHILRTHLDYLLRDQSLQAVAEQIEGFTPAQIMQLVREAKARARTEKAALSVNHLLAVLNFRPVPLAQRWRVAIHEAGHCTSAVLLDEPALRLKSASVRVLGKAGGHTMFESSQETPSLQSIEHHVLMLLSGRAAEMVILGGDKTAGAGGANTSDLASATKLVAAALGSFGLYESLLWRCEPADALHLVQKDPDFASEVESKLSELMLAAERLIAENAGAVRRVAKHLMKNNSADAATIGEIVKSSVPRITTATLEDPTQTKVAQP